MKWEGANLFVTLSKFDRRGMNTQVTNNRFRPRTESPKVIQRWVEVKRTEPEATKMSDGDGEKKAETSNRKKEIEGVWSQVEKERLQRSLLGVSVKPIEFRKVMNKLVEEWEGPGDIECKDVGPYRCLLTFSSKEICEGALRLPMCMWCVENVDRIAMLWGKTLKHDDRTEEPKSYSIARVLIDCFQWEQINEWVSIKIEDKVIEVFVKECGPEAYSIESHPNLDLEVSELRERSPVRSMTEESQAEVAKETGRRIVCDLNLGNVGDPQVEAIIGERSLLSVYNNYGGRIVGDADIEATRKEIERAEAINWVENRTDWWCGLHEDDPMAQNIVVGVSVCQTVEEKTHEPASTENTDTLSKGVGVVDHGGVRLTGNCEGVLRCEEGDFVVGVVNGVEDPLLSGEVGVIRETQEGRIDNDDPLSLNATETNDKVNTTGSVHDTTVVEETQFDGNKQNNESYLSKESSE
ncbi:hypothetical protein PIB30_026096 [Stylosanthes scabra]|uniref:DUF4283 domain-containing protein n=1 Tax=Stylosanthes scabra TaxID=79078 RepID=A0ABU6SAB7_9FABA|nr:hypothetical protein [Stylosanthes scabra]